MSRKIKISTVSLEDLIGEGFRDLKALIGDLASAPRTGNDREKPARRGQSGSPSADLGLTHRLNIGAENLPKGDFNAYLRLDDGMADHQDSIRLGTGPVCSMDRVSRIFSAVLNDDPLLFFCGINYQVEMGLDFVIHPQYRYSVRDANSKLRSMVAIAEKLRAEATEDPVDTEFLVNDYLARTVRYMNLEEMNNQFMDSALLERLSVCRGITHAGSFLLNYMGVPCGTVTGMLDGGHHAWNVVEVGGRRYNLDITNNKLCGNKVNYAFFNASDRQIARTHSTEWVTGCDDSSRMFTGMR